MKQVTRRTFVAWLTTALAALVAACAPRPQNSTGKEQVLTNLNNPPSKPNWNVRYYKRFYPVDTRTWHLKVEGLVENPGEFTLEELKAWPSVSQVSRMACVEGWSSKAEWAGFDYAGLAAMVKPTSEAKWLHFISADDYYEYMPVSEIDIPRVLFAYEMDGEPLQPLFGSPLRAIYPSKYGYKGAKAIVTIRFEAQGGEGYWSAVGPYSTDGTIQPGYDHPVDLGGERVITGGEITDY
ncbi:MAG: molybdopterin-dependent oxidoreductase [Anaerolineae bacterium]